VASGNLFESALAKTSVISEDFRRRFLSTPGSEDCLVLRVIVFEGPRTTRLRIEDPSLGIDETSMLVLRAAGPIAYPGSAEVVNMTPPGAAHHWPVASARFSGLDRFSRGSFDDSVPYLSTCCFVLIS
jgi:dihydroxyacid dehydratase/phosphogluconate dehydratase